MKGTRLTYKEFLQLKDDLEEKYIYCDEWIEPDSTIKDIERVIKTYGEPREIWLQDDGYFAILVYCDKIAVVGYDSKTENYIEIVIHDKAENMEKS